MRHSLIVTVIAYLIADAIVPAYVSGGIFCRRLRRNQCCVEEYSVCPPKTSFTGPVCRTKVIATYSFGGACAYRMYQMEDCQSHQQSAITLNCLPWATTDCDTQDPAACPARYLARPKIERPPVANENANDVAAQSHEHSDVAEMGTGVSIDDITAEGNVQIEVTRYQIRLPGPILTGDRWALLLWITPDGQDPIGVGYEIPDKLDNVTELLTKNHRPVIPGQPRRAKSFSVNAYVPNLNINRHYVVFMK